jgi:hypothetical protein
MEFTDRNRAKMDKIVTLDELDELLSSSNLLSDFVAYAERNGVKANESEIAAAEDVILAQLRAYIGRNALHDESGFYYNIYPIDNTLQRAVKELRIKLNKNEK